MKLLYVDLREGPSTVNSPIWKLEMELSIAHGSNPPEKGREDPQAGGTYVGRHFQGLDLHGRDLSEADFTRAEFVECTFIVAWQ